ncbi:nitrous oxide reductase family maturation protein NosD [Uliginosibacterium sp. sgz301328]|uniref:right-handed parallel beta-helix repeat-containing protein n=1 Tax=Uliginosibacterium sp. sgz301328 TaxID=3243764 RepID=UPI00359D9ECF
MKKKILSLALPCLLAAVAVSAAARPIKSTSKPAAPTAAPTTDCTVNVAPGADIQAAIDGLPRDGSRAVVCLSRGEYSVQRFVAIERDNTTLRGEGVETIVRLAPGVQSSVLLVGDYRQAQPAHVTRHVTIERMLLEGNGDQGGEFDPQYAYLTNSGVTVRSGQDIIIRELTVNNCRSAGILTEYSSANVLIQGNTVYGAIWDGISLNRALRTQVIGNTLAGNHAAGITTENLQDSEIRDNVLRNNGSHGIYLADAYRNEVSGNTFLHNGGSGVFITCSIRTRDPVRCWDNSMSSNNRFQSNTFAGNQYGYSVAPDDAANCKPSDVRANASLGDAFRDDNHEPSWDRYGRCLVYNDVRSLARN